MHARNIRSNGMLLIVSCTLCSTSTFITFYFQLSCFCKLHFKGLKLLVNYWQCPTLLRVLSSIYCKTVCPMLLDHCTVLSVCLSVCLSCLSVTLVYCGPTVGRFKRNFGVRVGLGPGHIVLDGDQLPLPQRGTHPIFGSYLLSQNGWMDQDATW